MEKLEENKGKKLAGFVPRKESNLNRNFGSNDSRKKDIAPNRLDPLISDFGAIHVKQLTAVTEYGTDDKIGYTQDKKIQTKNVGEAWFRFRKDGDKIDTFSKNETESSPKGENHVSKTIEISDDIDKTKYNIGDLTRAVHFSAGDRLIGIDKNFRKGKWTWHHKQNPFKMELVDMAVHKSFGHHGGFSKWQEDLNDDSDD